MPNIRETFIADCFSDKRGSSSFSSFELDKSILVATKARGWLTVDHCVFCQRNMEMVEALYGLGGVHVCTDCVRRCATAMARDKVPLRVRNYSPRTRATEVIIPCPSCRTKLRLVRLDPSLRHACRLCGVSFIAHKALKGRVRVDLDNLDINFNSRHNHHATKISSRSEAFVELEISPTALAAEIKSAYRKICQLYHPDKVANLGKELRLVAESKMKRINAAYELLS